MTTTRYPPVPPGGIEAASAPDLRRLVELAPDAMVMVSDGLVTFANPAFARLVGAAGVDAVLGLPMSRCLDRPFLKVVRSELMGTSFESAENTAEETLRRLDGTTRIVEVAAVPLMDGGQPAVQMFLRDVTQRRAAVDARHEAETGLSLLLDQTPAVFWTTDASLRLTSARGGCALASRFVQAIGREVSDLFDPADLADVQAAHRLGLAGQPATLALSWGGRAFELRVEGLVVGDGALAGTVGVALDVTERKEIEERVQDAAQLDALTRIAAGVAHEMNNVLAAIAALAGGLELDRALPADHRVSVEGILASSARGRDLISNLLGFARGGRYRRERFDLNGIGRAAAAWLGQQHPEVSVALALSAILPRVEGDPVQVRAAIQNLLQNAVEATPTGGRITLSARSATVDATSPVSPDLEPGTYAVIEVADEGAGMTEAVRQRALEPFFTTKGLGLGPGLGLSMAFGVARHHGGTLLLSSRLGHGTTVSVYLPAAEAVPVRPPAPAPAAKRDAPTTGRPQVLVIDDDEWVRFSTRRLLVGLGYEVVEANGGEPGLARFDEQGGRFAFVLLDLRMPGMGGEDVLLRLREADPDVRVVLFTGYTRDEVGKQAFQAGKIGFLSKPFTTPELEAQLKVVGAGPFPTPAGPVLPPKA